MGEIRSIVEKNKNNFFEYLKEDVGYEGFFIRPSQYQKWNLVLTSMSIELEPFNEYLDRISK